MNHLSDQEIQDYLDGLSPDGAPYGGDKIKQHLHTCSSCSQQAEAYKRVYSVLETEPGYSLSPILIDKVVKEISSCENRNYQKWETLLLIFTIVQGLGFAIYFTDFRTMISNLFIGGSSYFESTFSKITELGNGLLPIIVIAVIILSFYAILDRVIEQFRHS